MQESNQEIMGAGEVQVSWWDKIARERQQRIIRFVANKGRRNISHMKDLCQVKMINNDILYPS